MSAQLLHSIADLRYALGEARRGGQLIGLVPTMGALHAGHGALIELARREVDRLVVSVFVNPIQFDQKLDFEAYPRPLKQDVEFCSSRSVDIVFAPAVSEMYPFPQLAAVDVARLTTHLCGKFRPGHFRGVATVVLKLFNIVQPDRAYFGEKDAQQCAVIRRMVADLNVPVEVVEVPTVRDTDGLALSSRNQRLTPEQRRVAPVIYRTLQAAEQVISSGVTDPEQVRQKVLAALHAHPLIRLEYFEIVDPREMQPVHRITGPVRIAVAAWMGPVRLIDNILCGL